MNDNAIYPVWTSTPSNPANHSAFAYRYHSSSLFAAVAFGVAYFILHTNYDGGDGDDDGDDGDNGDNDNDDDNDDGDGDDDNGDGDDDNDDGDGDDDNDDDDGDGDDDVNYFFHHY